MRTSRAKFASILLAGFSLVALASCEATTSTLDGTTTTNNTTDNSADSNPADGYTSTDFFVYVGAPPTSANPNPPAPVSTLHVYNDWTQPCKITVADGKKDLLCYYEIEELDNWAMGRSFYNESAGQTDDRLWITYNIPSGYNCPFFKFTPFYYWRYEPGIGPSAVTVTIDNSVTPSTTTYASSADGYNASISASTGRCNKDYTQFTGANVGPNCCVGTYDLTTKTIATDGTQTTDTTSADWGGTWSSCLSGPAADTDMWAYHTTSNGYTNGFPSSILLTTAMYGGSLTQNFQFGGGWSRNMGTNAFSANYFDVTTAPDDYADPTKWPQAMQGPGVVSNGSTTYSFPAGRASYEAVCYDHAGDVLSRIRLMIRPWSADSEYATAKAGGAGSWKLSTAEGIPFADQATLDYSGWFDASGTLGSLYDFLTKYPGSAN